MIGTVPLPTNDRQIQTNARLLRPFSREGSLPCLICYNGTRVNTVACNGPTRVIQVPMAIEDLSHYVLFIASSLSSNHSTGILAIL